MQEFDDYQIDLYEVVSEAAADDYASETYADVEDEDDWEDADDDIECWACGGDCIYDYSGEFVDVEDDD